jgi:5'-3' exonuclease
VIIVDLHQVMLSNLFMQLGKHTNAELQPQMVKYMIFNSLKSYRQKFGEEYGELVIACDNTNCWRKNIFPYYKANRKKNIENSDLDWKTLFECLGQIRSELKEFFPYRVIDVETAEADDIIGVLVSEFGQGEYDGEKILILSGDKDFIQLHVYPMVKQYDPVRKKWIENDNPVNYLKEHILRGDSGDGVPNVLSPDNCLVLGERQKPLTARKIDQYLNTDIENLDNAIKRNYKRNEQLIDLSFTPSYIQETVMEQFDQQSGKDRSKLLNYFIANKMKNLTEHIMEF